MDVLVIESSPGMASALQHRLRRDGHDVISCTGSRGGPCRGVETNESCPMEQHVDVAILARDPGAERSIDEMAAVCASRHRVPLLTLCPDDEFEPGRSTEVAVAVARREVEAHYAAVIRRHLRHGVDDIVVQRDDQRVQVTITVDRSMSAQTIFRVADRARQAVREYDALTPAVDVSIVRAETRIG
jgi:hypothetical protein